MKALKIITSILSFVVISAATAATVLTVWANKPRGIKIDISKINPNY